MCSVTIGPGQGIPRTATAFMTSGVNSSRPRTCVTRGVAHPELAGQVGPKSAPTAFAYRVLFAHPLLLVSATASRGGLPLFSL